MTFNSFSALSASSLGLDPYVFKTRTERLKEAGLYRAPVKPKPRKERRAPRGLPRYAGRTVFNDETFQPRGRGRVKIETLTPHDLKPMYYRDGYKH